MKIEFINYLKEGEGYVNGEEMLKRGGSDMAGQEDLDYYLEHQDEIPKEYSLNQSVNMNSYRLFHKPRR